MTIGPRYLVIGASGFLGARLFEVLSMTSAVIGTCCSRWHPGLARVDLRDADAVRALIARVRPDCILHAAGMTRPDACEACPEDAWQVNVAALGPLLGAAPQAKLVFFSTDYVFDGKRGHYTESDSPAPVNAYGASKLDAERMLLASTADALIIRVAGLYGASMLNDEFREMFDGEAPLTASSEHWSSCTYIDDICAALPHMRELSGVIHLVGPEVLTRADFAATAAQLLGSRRPVLRVPGAQAYPAVRRPRDSSLVSERFHYPMTELREGLRRTAALTRLSPAFAHPTQYNAGYMQ